jgi:CheY-like chemotaxis protein
LASRDEYHLSFFSRGSLSSDDFCPRRQPNLIPAAGVFHSGREEEKMDKRSAGWRSVAGAGGLQKKKLIKVVESILLVDGIEESRASLKFLLELQGFRVIEAHHGIEGLQVLCEWGCDIQLALCAPELPDMTGGEWMGQMRFLGPQIPSMLLTEREALEASEWPVGPAYAGMPAKPPGPARLLRRIREAMDEYFFARCESGHGAPASFLSAPYPSSFFAAAKVA